MCIVSWSGRGRGGGCIGSMVQALLGISYIHLPSRVFLQTDVAGEVGFYCQIEAA